MSEETTAAVPKATRKSYAWCRLHGGLIALSALYLVLSFFRIGHQSLWTDEVISLNRTATFTTLWSRIDSQSPVYFNLLGLWTDGFGTTEGALRSFSVLFGLSAIWLAYAIGLRLFNRRVAVLLALLLGTSPYLIWYAQEVRYITLLIAASLAMTYFLQRAMSAGTWQWWMLYGLTSALALFTFQTVVFLLIAHGLYLLHGGSRRRFLKPWLASQIIIIVSFVVWFVARPSNRIDRLLTEPVRLVSPHQVRSRGKLPVTDLVGAIPYTFFTFSAGFSLGPSVRELHESRTFGALLPHAPTLIPVGLVFGSLFVLGLAQLRKKSPAALFVLLWLGVPIAGVFLAATLTRYHVYNTRYVAMALPAYLFIIALGLAAIRNSLVLAAVLLVHGVSLYNYYFDVRFARDDTRAVVEYLAHAAQPRDAIVAVGNMTTLNHYYKGSLPIFHADSRNSETWPAVVHNLCELGQEHERLWLVEVRAWERDRHGKVRAELDSVADRVAHKEFPGIDVYAYESTPKQLDPENRGARCVTAIKAPM